MISPRILPLLLIAALIPAGASPASPSDIPNSPPLTRWSFRAYTNDQGLLNMTINLLMQDREGFIWVCTDGGTYRYGGGQFELFGPERGLREQHATAIHLDGKGNVWVGSRRGLALLRTGGFETITQGLPADTEVEDLAEGPGGDLWVATGKGLYGGTAESGFRLVRGWTDSAARSICAVPNSGRIWVVGARDLWRRNPGGDLQVIDAAGPASLDGLESAIEDRQGRVWIRSIHFLWVLQPGDLRPRVVNDRLRSDRRISRMYLDSRGVLWVPNENGLANLENDRWTEIGIKDGLPTPFARAVLVDHEGSLWVGSVGLYRIIGRGTWSSATAQEGLPGPALSFSRSSDVGLLVGTQKGLARMTADGWGVVKGTERTCVRSLALSPEGTCFLAGEPAGILAWDPRSGKLAALPGIPGGSSRILHLLFGPDNRLWIGTARTGLFAARKSEGAWRITREPLPGASSDESIYDLILDRGGRLWAAGDNGLACSSGGSWTRYTKKDGLLSDEVTYIAEAPSGDLWVAYYDNYGLSRVRFENGRLRVVQSIGLEEGLSSVNIFLIGLDAKERVWVGSEKGVDVIERPESSSPRILHFGLEDGLIDEETNAMAFLADPNGDCWVGTRSGIGHFAAARSADPPPPPKTAIFGAFLGKRPISDLPGSLVRVSHRDNTLEAKFASLSFISEASVERQIRLLGLEENWVTIGAREMRYPGLDPGPYRLEIRSRTGNGDWGPPASLSFTILPPWWKTTLAQSGAILALLALIYLIVSLRTETLRRRAKKLESLVNERTRELAARTEELDEANKALRTLTFTDALTGLRNRRFLDLTLPDYIAQVNRAHHQSEAARKGSAPANADLMLAMLDIDRFKPVNDNYGHDAGDRMLTQIAIILQDTVRGADTITRWGGDEFLLAIRSTSREEGSTIAERIRSRVASHAFDLGGGTIIRCTCSIGFAFYPVFIGRPQFFIWENVVEMADWCLRAAKRSGRNAWIGVLASPEADSDEMKRQFPADLEKIVRTGLLRPITSLGDPARIVWEPSERERLRPPG
jgi:diguanylate cyclase (GGDEF)-like protein